MTMEQPDYRLKHAGPPTGLIKEMSPSTMEALESGAHGKCALRDTISMARKSDMKVCLRTLGIMFLWMGSEFTAAILGQVLKCKLALRKALGVTGMLAGMMAPTPTGQQQKFNLSHRADPDVITQQ